MPEVKSAKAATELALAFIKAYYRNARPVKAAREGSSWLVEIDVGPLTTKIAKVKIDAATGDAVEYTVPS